MRVRRDLKAIRFIFAHNDGLNQPADKDRAVMATQADMPNDTSEQDFWRWRIKSQENCATVVNFSFCLNFAPQNWEEGRFRQGVAGQFPTLPIPFRGKNEVFDKLDTLFKAFRRKLWP